MRCDADAVPKREKNYVLFRKRERTTITWVVVVVALNIFVAVVVVSE